MRLRYQPNIVLDRESPTPLHAQISELIGREITEGILSPGTLLENEVSLARRLKVSRPTARRAMQTLVEQGLLLRRRGAGTIVAPKPRHRIGRLSSLNEEIRGAGKLPSTEVLTYQHTAASETVARLLDRPIGSPVVELERLRYRDGVPLAILYNWLPAEFAPGSAELNKSGLYELMRNAGVKIASTTQSVSAERPKLRHAKLLAITPRQPVLIIERTAFDDHGHVVEWGRHVYRGDLYHYESTVFAQAD
ncbi:MAG: GntR family transcriptional regulator [Actinomycetaceae bacterium]|nr:GntR family transcriptional regulator [Actinomycetaceae bacterium]